MNDKKFRELKDFCDSIWPMMPVSGTLAFVFFKHRRALMLLGSDRERAENLGAELDGLFENIPADIVSKAVVDALIRKRLNDTNAESEVQDFVLQNTPVQGGRPQ